MQLGNSRQDNIKLAINELLDSSSVSEDKILEFIDDDCGEEKLLFDVLEAFELKKRNSILNYLNGIVPKYTEEEFKMHFRISRDLYLTLAERFEESKYYKSMRPTKCIPSKTYLATFLWFAGHEACSFRDLSDRFNLSISSKSQIIDKVTLFVSSLSPEVIKWPTEERKAASATFFNNKCGFSKAIGK